MSAVTSPFVLCLISERLTLREDFTGRIDRREISRVEDLANLDRRAATERRARNPSDCFFLRFHLDDPVASDELLRFGERTVGDFGFSVVEGDARALRRRVQAVAR